MKADNTINGRTPEEIKKGLECCTTGNYLSCRKCPYEQGGCGEDENLKDALAYIKRLEEVVMLMVLQYCQADGKLDHQFMCAGEQAFTVLGLKQYDPIEELHKLMDEAGVI